MPKTEEATTTMEWVYCGERIARDGGVLHVWHPTNWLTDDDASKLYGPKNITRHAVVGGVYVVTLTEDGKVLASGADAPKWKGALPTDDDIAAKLVAEWKTLDSETKTMRDATSALKKAKREHDGLGTLTLDQLAREYRDARTGPRRNALIAAVIGHMTSTRVDDRVD